MVEVKIHTVMGFQARCKGADPCHWRGLARLDKAEAKADADKHAATHVPGAVPHPTLLDVPEPPTSIEDIGDGKVGHNHPTTSKRAATKTMRRGTERHECLAAFMEAGSNGLTALEAKRAYDGRSPNQTATRILELREVGYLMDTGEERTTTRGNTGKVWRITPAGIAEIARLAAV